MEDHNIPVTFPLLSLNTHSELIANNNFSEERHIVIDMIENGNFFEEGPKESELIGLDIPQNGNFFEEGPKESELIDYNNFLEEGPLVTEMVENSFFKKQPAATDLTANNNIFVEGDRARDIVVNSTIIEEGPRICPLCGSVVKLFFMNFHEKLLMCENVECDFPFGHEDLQIVQVDTGVQFIEAASTLNSTSSSSKMPRSSPTCSVISTSAWSELSKLTRDTDSSHFDKKSSVISACEREDKLKRQLAIKEKEDKTLKNLNDIKQINAALKEYKDRPKTNIKNKKWLYNMKSLEDMSGVKLLTKNEKKKLKNKKQQQLGRSEFKIDIGTANDDMSAINIQITNTGQAST